MSNQKIAYPNILITGVSSSIGYMVAKLIQTYQGLGALYFANNDANCPAQALCSSPLIISEVFEQDYFDYLYRLIQKHKIDILIPCTLGQIKLLSRHKKEIYELGCRVLTENHTMIDIYYDKLSTIHYLQQREIPVLKTSEISEINGKCQFPNLSYPFFIKPRLGSGSRGIRVIHNESEFLNWDSDKLDKLGPYIAQEYLDHTLEEYSCSCTYSKDGLLKDIMAIQRKAMDSVTTKAEYNKTCEIVEESIRAIASRLGGQYVLNLQFKVRCDVPYIFEINPRLGSAEAIRIQFGMDALYSVLSEYCEVDREVQPKRYGTVWRVYEEVFVPAEILVR
jgi:carbamoyl-phosphate synthase large subunit